MTDSKKIDNLVALVESLRKLSESQQNMNEFEDYPGLYLLDKNGVKILL